MDHDRSAKRQIDLERYERIVQEGPCFICAMVAGDVNFEHHVLYEDEKSVAFLSRYPTLEGYCLVAPKQHVEDWVNDLSEPDFFAMMRVVRRVAQAVAATVPTERMYFLGLGSQQGVAHLHWHLAPLPPGVPYNKQQFYALMMENGVLQVDERSQAKLARAARGHLNREGMPSPDLI